MTDTFRAMCAELADVLDNLHALMVGECPSLLDGDRGGSGFLDIEIDDALTTARALLDQPELEGPTDEELDELFNAHCYTDDFGTHLMDAACFRECIRTARRPNPPTLKEQALSELNLTADPDGAELSRTQVELIRRALEAL